VLTQQKVTAVVVTYNRLQYLKLVIAALRKQTYPLQSIVVVNNDSSDGTKAWLNEQEGLHVIHQSNVGGAGGFNTGMKAANKKGTDWIWLIDDDVLPDVGCLETLLQYSSYSACLHPLKIEPDGEAQDEERWFDAADCRLMDAHNFSYRHGKKVWYRNVGSFEGMLIATEIIEKIGFPDPRFFIAHDDLIYGFLASKYTNVMVVANAVLRRQPVVRPFQSRFNYEYYMLRNLRLLEEYAAKELPGYEGYRRRRILWQFMYAVYKILFVERRGHTFKSLQIVYQAYRDYRRKKEGMK
jgi:rhamnopyranosyl-N-acetylglucosaminyl-diphospho-decaprenol beta-1,3/1,4-galactofuranosyltransferase